MKKKEFNLSNSYKKELIQFIKNMSNVEIGGNRFYDGTGTHYIQNPHEKEFTIVKEEGNNERIVDFSVRYCGMGHYYVIAILRNDNKCFFARFSRDFTVPI